MIRLLSYNIRKAVGLDWRRDPMRIAHVIAEAAPDVVALQEADKRLGPRPAALPPEAIAATGLMPVHVDEGPSIGWHGNALLVRPDWPVDEVRGIGLPGLEPRGALMARIRTPLGPLTLCGTHLGLARASRLRQMRTLCECLGDRLPEAVIAADMNEWSARTGFEPLTGHGMTLLDPGHSFHAARPVASLDRIALGAKWRAQATGVLHTLHTSRASDHLPVWASIVAA